jgi:phosphoglycolate phosphatase
MNTQKPTILFDFDGTLAETLMLIHTVFNQLSPVYGYRQMPEEDIEIHRHRSVRGFLKHFEIPLWKLPVIAIHARRLMHDEIHEVHPPKGLVEVLNKIHDSGRYTMSILTSNHRKNVLKFLAEHSMGWFDEVQATHGVLSKKRRVKKYIRQNNLDPQNLYYVGDTNVDVESARRAGARSVAVTWGLNTSEALARTKPDYLVDHPSELLDIFKVVQEN